MSCISVTSKLSCLVQLFETKAYFQFHQLNFWNTLNDVELLQLAFMTSLVPLNGTSVQHVIYRASAVNLIYMQCAIFTIVSNVKWELFVNEEDTKIVRKFGRKRSVERIDVSLYDWVQEMCLKQAWNGSRIECFCKFTRPF